MFQPPPPELPVGTLVVVVANQGRNTPRTGRVRKVVWHFKDHRYNYYIETNGKKVSKRYFAGDLRPTDRITPPA